MFSLVFLLTLTATTAALRTTSIVDRSSKSPKVKSQFLEVGNQHYFRKTGRMIGAASFAHIAYEIDLNLPELAFGVHELSVLEPCRSEYDMEQYVSGMFQRKYSLFLLQFWNMICI